MPMHHGTMPPCTPDCSLPAQPACGMNPQPAAGRIQACATCAVHQHCRPAKQQVSGNFSWLAAGPHNTEGGDIVGTFPLTAAHDTAPGTGMRAAWRGSSRTCGQTSTHGGGDGASCTACSSPQALVTCAWHHCMTTAAPSRTVETRVAASLPSPNSQQLLLHLGGSRHLPTQTNSGSICIWKQQQAHPAQTHSSCFCVWDAVGRMYSRANSRVMGHHTCSRRGRG